MAALATLTTTALVTPVLSSDTSILVQSATGIQPGLFLYADRELMKVTSVGIATAAGTNVNIQRGQEGTAATGHVSLSPVIIGRGDQFYFVNPSGAPASSPLVTPWVNVLTGEQWTVQGDQSGLNSAPYWAHTLFAHGIGPLGVMTDTPTTSTNTLT